MPPDVAKNIPVDKLLAGFSNVSTQSLATGGGGADALKAQLLQAGTPPSAVDTLANLINTAMKNSLFSGIQEAFLIGAILLGFGFVFTIFLKEIPLRKSNRGPAAGAGMAEGAADLEYVLEEAGREFAAGGLPATELSSEEEPDLVQR